MVEPLCIVKLGDIPCLNFGGRGKSRSIGKRSSRGERDDSEGEMRGLRGEWYSGSDGQGSESDGDGLETSTRNGRGRQRRDGGSVGDNAALSDEEMMGGGANPRTRTSTSIERY